MRAVGPWWALRTNMMGPQLIWRDFRHECVLSTFCITWETLSVLGMRTEGDIDTKCILCARFMLYTHEACIRCIRDPGRCFPDIFLALVRIFCWNRSITSAGYNGLTDTHTGIERLTSVFIIIEIRTSILVSIYVCMYVCLYACALEPEKLLHRFQRNFTTWCTKHYAIT